MNQPSSCWSEFAKRMRKVNLMPTRPTRPGVYIEERSSGVRSITGVASSVAAFVGPARRGPINRAVRIVSFSEFEQRFGGLSAPLETGYAVRQFFVNGGIEAWVVRVARNANLRQSTELGWTGGHA